MPRVTSVLLASALAAAGLAAALHAQDDPLAPRRLATPPPSLPPSFRTLSDEELRRLILELDKNRPAGAAPVDRDERFRRLVESLGPRKPADPNTTLINPSSIIDSQQMRELRQQFDRVERERQAATPTRPAPTPSPNDPRGGDANQPSAPAARPVLGSAATVNLSYTEKLDPKQPDRRGGLVGGVEAVTAQMSAMKTPASASGSVTVLSQLEQTQDGRTLATVAVTASQIKIDPEISDGPKAALQQEAQALLTELANWRAQLTPEQLATLRDTGSLTLPVTRPLALVRTWKHSGLNVTLSLGAPGARVTAVRFFAIGRSGVYPIEKLIDRMPAFAEVTFDRPPQEPTFVLELNGRSGVTGLRVNRLAGDPARYRSSRFLPLHDDGGLGLPPTRSTGASPAAPGADAPPPNYIPRVNPNSAGKGGER